MIGETVDKYRVVSRLGRGGMGAVYKAVDETLGREVAIKILHPDLADQEVLKRFRAEAVTLARLNHPNIATLYELTEHGGDLLMVMEFVNGETFDSLLERTGPMPVEQAAQLCAQVLDALGHAHRAGIVHRDLKPANLMLAESGLVKVMDFGIARMAGTEHLTTDGHMMGTPAYMAPEQVLGHELDGRADLYAMGVVLYRLLTAQLPFTAETEIAMAQKHINDPPLPLRERRPDLQRDCEAVVARALAKLPVDRYQTADEFRAALAALTAGGAQERVMAATPPVGGAFPLVAAATVALIIAIGGTAAWLWKGSHAAPPATGAPAGAVTVAPDAGEKGPANAKKMVVPLVFKDVKLLTFEAHNRTRERDAMLRLGPESLEVLDGSRLLVRTPYDAIVAVFHSRSKDPRWARPDGTAVSIAKVGGRFSFLKGDPDWITVRTKSAFMPIRVKRDSVATMIANIQERTGVRVTPVAR